MPDDRRRFSRIPFDAPVRLHQEDWHAVAGLVDISLRGLLILQPDGWSRTQPDQPFHAVIELSPVERIHMDVRMVSPARTGRAGVSTRISPISHLKRLIMLNLGDEALAERELAALYH